MSEIILTIGHSAHRYAAFLAVLREARVSAIADVRTTPYSRRHPQFNREALGDALRRDGIEYIFLGSELGGRPSESGLHRDGIADYEKMACGARFEAGLARVMREAEDKRIALMCAEQDPLDCHRCLLVGRALAERGIAVAHILSTGKLVTQSEIEARLLALAGADDLFSQGPAEDRLALAYRARARSVASRRPAAGARRGRG